MQVLLVSALAVMVPQPRPAAAPPTRLEALRSIVTQAGDAFRGGGATFMRVSVVDALHREITR